MQMRWGLLSSATAHAALILVGLVSLGTAEALQPEPIDSIAVELVPVSEFSSVRIGTLESEIVETDTPSVVDSEAEAELATVTGNTEVNQPDPTEANTPSPMPSINTAPEQAAPEPAPTPPAPELAVAPTPEPDPQQVAPAPVVRTAALEQKRAEFKKQQEAAKKAAEAKKAEEKKLEEEKRKKRDAALEEILTETEPDQVASIINNEDSRGATTGQGGDPTLGKPTGLSATLSQSEMDGLMKALYDCFFVAVPPREGSIARILITFNRDRSVASQQVMEITGPDGEIVARAGNNAIGKCAMQNKFNMLADEKFDQWQQVDVIFNPALM